MRSHAKNTFIIYFLPYIMRNQHEISCEIYIYLLYLTLHYEKPTYVWHTLLLIPVNYLHIEPEALVILFVGFPNHHRNKICSFHSRWLNQSPIKKNHIK